MRGAGWREGDGGPRENGTSLNAANDGSLKKSDVSQKTYADSDGLEEVESWECARDEEGQFICPIALLDEQSGRRPAGDGKDWSNGATHGTGTRNAYGKGMERKPTGQHYSDAGGASRFFLNLPPENTEFHEPDTGPGFYYAPKASRRERTANGTVANGHPTVKNLSLMRYLVRLVTPPDGTVLDPFMGSGTTGIAAIKEGFNFIGIEQELEYYEISRARLAHHAQELEKTREETLFA